MKPKPIEESVTSKAEIVCKRPCGQKGEYGRCYIPEGRYSYHLCPTYLINRRLSSPDVFFLDIPDNSKLLQLAEINHPRVIQFIRKLEKANPNCTYLELQRSYA